jgi:PTH1 family peptidyl-tRNA hydrolase
VLAVVGLGNPGPRYACTRHNVGFRVVDRLRRRHGLPAFASTGPLELSRGRCAGRPVALARPTTYMNRSGEAVRALLELEPVPVEALLVVADDVYLPPGRLRLRRRGGDGGHNGLRSIIESIGSREFPRLRIGIGGDADPAGLSDHVLGEFSDAESAIIERAIVEAVEAVETVLGAGIGEAMNRFNAARETG